MSDKVIPIKDDDDGGAIGRTLTHIFGRSYRTTIVGVLATVAGGLAAVGHASPGLVPPPLVAIATALAPILAGGGLVMAKDQRVSGPPRR